MDYGPALESTKEAQAWLERHGRRFGLFIDNAWSEPGELFASNNPADGSRLAELTQAGESDVGRAVDAARRALPLWLQTKLHLPRELDRGLRGGYRGRFVFPSHHQSHAASAFFPSPFEEAAILTLDGVGEWATTCFGAGRGNRIELTHEIRFPHSLGLLYSAFTYYTGFKVNSGEYKLMGLAPYGRPVYADRIRRHLIDDPVRQRIGKRQPQLDDVRTGVREGMDHVRRPREIRIPRCHISHKRL